MSTSTSENSSKDEDMPQKKHPDTSKDYGGLIINEKDASNTKVVLEIMKNLAKKLVTLNVLDMLKFSRPAKITSPFTVHQCSAKEYIQTGLLSKAYELNSDPIERMKYICAFFLSGVHISPDICRSKAPFNPILGETFQARHPDGTEIYMEQTVHHPPTFNFLVNGPQKHFQLMGYGSIIAHLDGLNTIRGWRDGKTILKFDDGSMFTANNFKTRINGVMMGERLYNYYGVVTIKDYKNKIELTMTLDDQEKEGMISKFFSKRKTCQYDEFRVEIKQVNPQTKEKEVKATGYGSWLGQLYFGNKCYWSIFDEKTDWSQEGLWLLPSDSSKREDLICVLKGDIDNAQKEKERLEELQRQDQKKRDEYASKQ